MEQASPLIPKPAGYQPVHVTNPNTQYPVIQTQLGSHYLPSDHGNMPRPDNYIGLVMCTLLCCMYWPALFCAVIAVIYSLQVDISWDVGHHVGAHSAAEKAKKWAIGAIVAGFCVLAGIAAYLGVYFGYLREHMLQQQDY